MPFCTDGVTDMFEPMPFNLSTYSDDCARDWYGVRPITDVPSIRYGDRGEINSSSNIIFR